MNGVFGRDVLWWRERENVARQRREKVARQRREKVARQRRERSR
jgi:hypothetical protein